jgi:hypothetical protein
MIARYAATSVCSFVSSASVYWRETVETSRIPAHSAPRCANGARSSVAFTAMTTAGDAPSLAVSAPPSAARLLRENAARLCHVFKTEMFLVNERVQPRAYRFEDFLRYKIARPFSDSQTRPRRMTYEIS